MVGTLLFQEHYYALVRFLMCLATLNISTSFTKSSRERVVKEEEEYKIVHISLSDSLLNLVNSLLSRLDLANRNTTLRSQQLIDMQQNIQSMTSTIQRLTIQNQQLMTRHYNLYLNNYVTCMFHLIQRHNNPNNSVNKRTQQRNRNT